MKSIRIGKDINLAWTITIDGVSRDLAGLDLSLYLHHDESGVRKQVEFTTSFDTLRFTFAGTEQRKIGVYRATIWLNKGKSGQAVLDDSTAFRLVPRTEMEGGTDDNVQTASVELSGNLATDGVPQEVYERLKALEQAKFSVRIIEKTIEYVTVPAGDTKNVQEDLGIPDGYDFLAYRGIATERVQASSAKKHISFQTFGSAGGGKKCNITFYNNGIEDEILLVNLQVVCYKIG